jgi:hypothetical protein
MKSMYQHESLMIQSLMKMVPADSVNTTEQQAAYNNLRYEMTPVGNFLSISSDFNTPPTSTDGNLPLYDQPL